MSFQFRRDLEIVWKTANTVLADGEPAYTTDTLILKIGDGITPYNNLPQYGGFDQSIAGGRLSVLQNVPVPPPWGSENWTTASNTLWYVPYRSDKISLWSGATWQQYRFNNTTKLLLTGLSANKNFDVFAYQVNGTVTLSAVQWINNVYRATGLTYLNGVLVRSGMVNMRYIGTFRTTNTPGNTADNLTRRFVYNHYNRIQRPMWRVVRDPHTYSSSIWRIWNNSLNPDNYLQLVRGFQEPLAVYAQTFLRFGYFQLRTMFGLPYSTTVAAPANAGATSLTLTSADDNITPFMATIAIAGIATDPLIGISAVSGNTVNLTAPLPANVSSGAAVIIGPQIWTLDTAANSINPGPLGGGSFATATVSGILPTTDGLTAIIPCEYGLSSDSVFNVAVIAASPDM
jgi:hypothetical protein